MMLCLGEGELHYDLEGLNNILKELKIPVVCANLYLKKEDRLFPGIKSFLIKDFQNIRFAITGLLNNKAIILAREQANKSLPGLDELDIKSPGEILQEIISEAKEEGAQKFILLSHLGIDQDATLAEKFNEIDVIVSGHSHSYLAQPVRVKNTFIISSGSGGNYLGSLTLNIADIISLKISK